MGVNLFIKNLLKIKITFAIASCMLRHHEDNSVFFPFGKCAKKPKIYILIPSIL